MYNLDYFRKKKNNLDANLSICASDMNETCGDVCYYCLTE